MVVRIIKFYIVLLLAALLTGVFPETCFADSTPEDSVLTRVLKDSVKAVIPDNSKGAASLSLPGEIFIITAAELTDYNINTLDDILEIIPGVSFWREGPPGSATGFSIRGGKNYGMNLLVNGMPMNNIYTSEPLTNFIDLSRIIRIEVIYGGSPFLTGHISNDGVINIVLERGGREPPFAQANFTYGDNNRRARRIWFSTPKSYINGTIIYNQYLQDSFKSLEYYPNYNIGRDDARSVALELSFGTDPKHKAFVHFGKFKDTYAGSACSSIEDIRSSGFDSWIRYRHSGLKVSVRNFGFERKRLTGSTSGLRSALSLIYDKKMWRTNLRSFFSSRRDLFENRFEGERFNPEIENYEGGFAVSSYLNDSFVLRTGIYGGKNSVAGRFLGGEFGISRKGKAGAYENLTFSRKMIVPSAAMLFNPKPDSTYDCYDVRNEGNIGLTPEINNEVSLQKYFSSGILINLFYRNEDSGIISRKLNGMLYNSSDIQEVSGVRARYGGDGEYNGVNYGYSINGEYYLSRSDYTYGIPEYRVSGNIFIKIPVFKKTEIFTIRLNSIQTGRRYWGAEDIKPASVQNISASITIMSAIIKLQIRNILDSQYNTVPGYYMEERHFRIGIIWDLVN